MNKDNIATAVGMGLAAVQAAQVNWVSAFNGDGVEIMKAVFAFLLAALGYITNHKTPPAK